MCIAVLRKPARAQVVAPLLVVCCAVLLAGCAAPAQTVGTPVAASTGIPVKAHQRSVPMPDSALLKPLPAPDCQFKGDAGSPEAQRQKLDYQEQCYRQAEAIARARLQRLQEQVDEAVKAAKGRKRGAGGR